MTGTSTPETTVSVLPVTPAVYLQRVDELVRLHLRAMGYGPAAFDQRRILWAANSTSPGFTASVALGHDSTVAPDPADRNQVLLGIAYGFPGQSTSWWYREVHRGLRAAGMSAGDATATLADYDEVSEVHVMPGHQGHGIGRRLMEDLLSRLGSPTALLSTPEVADGTNAAWTLYRDLGFRDLLRGFRFASDPRPFGILARPRPVDGNGSTSPDTGTGTADGQRTAS